MNCVIEYYAYIDVPTNPSHNTALCGQNPPLLVGLA